MTISDDVLREIVHHSANSEEQLSEKALRRIGKIPQASIPMPWSGAPAAIRRA